MNANKLKKPSQSGLNMTCKEYIIFQVHTQKIEQWTRKLLEEQEQKRIKSVNSN